MKRVVRTIMDNVTEFPGFFLEMYVYFHLVTYQRYCSPGIDVSALFLSVQKPQAIRPTCSDSLLFN